MPDKQDFFLWNGSRFILCMECTVKLFQYIATFFQSLTTAGKIFRLRQIWFQKFEMDQFRIENCFMGSQNFIQRQGAGLIFFLLHLQEL